MPQPSKPVHLPAAPPELGPESGSAPDGEQRPMPPAGPSRLSFGLMIRELAALDTALESTASFSKETLADLLGRLDQVQRALHEARQVLEQDYQRALPASAQTLDTYGITPRIMDKIATFAARGTRHTLRATSRGFRDAVGPVTAARAERSADVPRLIEDLPHLKKLDLRDCLDILPDAHLAPNHEAALACQAALEALGQATQLEELNLPLCRGGTDPLWRLFGALRGLTQLTRLTADDAAHRNLPSLLSDEILQLITRHHPKLTELPGLRLASREGVALLMRLDNLSHLTLELSRPDRAQLDTLAKVVPRLDSCTLRLDATALGLDDFHTLIEALPVHRSVTLELRAPSPDVSDALRGRGLRAFATRPIQRFVSSAVLGLPAQPLR